jgi:hypothetical protein
MDLVFGASEGSSALPVSVVSHRSNTSCCGVLCCFENHTQTHKEMAMCALFRRLRPTMKAANTATDTTDAVRRGRGKPLSNGEGFQILQALLSHSTSGKLHTLAPCLLHTLAPSLLYERAGVTT